MPTIHLISPPGVNFTYKEQLGCADETMILIKFHDGRQMKIPKSNIAYLDDVYTV